MYTGSNGIDEIGRLRIVNDESVGNKLFSLFNGTQFVTVAESDYDETLAQKQLDGVSAGMQFPPGIEDDDQLRVFDSQSIKIITYNHEKSTSIGKKFGKLPLEKYKASSFGGNIGFSRNLYLY